MSTSALASIRAAIEHATNNYPLPAGVTRAQLWAAVNKHLGGPQVDVPLEAAVAAQAIRHRVGESHALDFVAIGDQLDGTDKLRTVAARTSAGTGAGSPQGRGPRSHTASVLARIQEVNSQTLDQDRDAADLLIAEKTHATNRTPGQRLLLARKHGEGWSDAGWTGRVDAAGAISADNLQHAAAFDAVSPTDQGVESAATQPAPDNLLSLIEVVPTSESKVRLLVEQPVDGDAHGVPQGAALPEVTVDWANEREPLDLWGAVTTVPGSFLTSPRAVRRLVDVTLLNFVRSRLAHEMIVGDGEVTPTRRQLLGVREVGLATVARDTAGGETRAAAIDRAGAAVQQAGFMDQPLAAVASPTTLQQLRDEPAPDHQHSVDRRPPPPVSTWVPSTAVPDGEVIVGDWFAAAVLFLLDPGLAVTAHDQHADYARKQLVLLRAFGDVLFWVRRPDALRIVEL